MLRVKYRVKPLPFVKLIDRGFKTLANNLSYYSVAPLKTDRETVFISGCGHSGTTLLTGILSRHPAVFTVARESNNFSIMRNLYCSREIAREWCYTAEQHRKSHIVEKTPKHVHTAGRIMRVLPNARLVFLVRNPLDTCASLYLRFKNLDCSIERWITDNNAVLAAQKRFPDSCLLVSYEELTRNPEDELRRLCEFLNLPWDSSILEEGETAFDAARQERDTMRLRREQIKGSIRENSGTWRKRLTEEQAERVRGRTLALAVKLGYDDTIDYSK